MSQYYNPYKMFVGSFIPNWLMKCSKISSTAKLCYARLAQYAGETGYCYPNQEQLAEELGISRRQVIRVLKELEAKTFIEVEKPNGLDKLKHFRNKYRFIYNQFVPCDIDVTSGCDTDVTSKKDNHIKDNHKEHNGLRTDVQRQHVLSFEKYNALFPVKAEVSNIISLYMQAYKHFRDKAHPPLRPATWNDVVLAIAGSDYEYDGHKEMINRHFTMTYSKPIDYNICHYATDGIMEKRFFETAY